MNRFEGLSLENARSVYHKLAKQLHPDHGGDLETMKNLNNDYAAFLAGTAKAEAYTRQTEAHAAGKRSAADFHDMNEVERLLFEKIRTILNLSGSLVVELCGLWVWVSGDTKPVKDQIKAAGFNWSPDKRSWYYAGVPSFNRHHWSMDAIRNHYGSTQFKNSEETSIVSK